MKIRFVLLTALIFAFATMAMAADDPFTGTWRSKTQPKIPSRVGQLIIAPVSGGISIQQGDLKPDIALYGKDSLIEGLYWNIVRIDDHTFKTTASKNGTIIMNESATVSPDGKRYTRIQEEVGSNSKSALEYERIGPVPTGEAFFGTWQRIGPMFTAPVYTLKVDTESFDFTALRGHQVTARFDGKEYKQDGGETTFILKRIDSNTIELLRKTPPQKVPEDIAAKIPPEMAARLSAGARVQELWQVKGDTLRITRQPLNDSQAKPSVTEFERIK